VAVFKPPTIESTNLAAKSSLGNFEGVSTLVHEVFKLTFGFVGKTSFLILCAIDWSYILRK
jgi:pantothenate synthetase